MTPKEFISDFTDDEMPSKLGPEMTLESHEPQFRKADLRQMAKLGLIVLDDKSWTYRLTLKAKELHDNSK